MFVLNLYSYSIPEARRGIDFSLYDGNEDISDIYDQIYTSDHGISNHKEEVQIDCDTKNLPNNTIEKIGQNVPICCELKGYISQKFRKVCRCTITLACLIIVQQILLIFQKIFTYTILFKTLHII